MSSILPTGLIGLVKGFSVLKLRELWNYNFSNVARSVEGTEPVLVQQVAPGRFRVELDLDAVLGAANGGDGDGGDGGTTIINNIINNQTFNTYIQNLVTNIITEYLNQVFTTATVTCEVTCNEDGSLSATTITAVVPAGSSCG